VTKSVRITVETSSLLMLRAQTAERAWCEQCATESEVVALDRIGVISNLDREALEEWLNSGTIHRLESPNGSPLICRNSLLIWIQTTTCGFPQLRVVREEDQ
jgi:hypothetical protein